MNVKDELFIASANHQRVSLILRDGEKINGEVSQSTDPERTKIQTTEGSVWVPYEDIECIKHQMLH